MVPSVTFVAQDHIVVRLLGAADFTGDLIVEFLVCRLAVTEGSKANWRDTRLLVAQVLVGLHCPRFLQSGVPVHQVLYLRGPCSLSLLEDVPLVVGNHSPAYYAPYCVCNVCALCKRSLSTSYVWQHRVLPFVDKAGSFLPCEDF